MFTLAPTVRISEDGLDTVAINVDDGGAVVTLSGIAKAGLGMNLAPGF